MARMDSRVVLVTGAARGLGAAVCQWMINEGANTVVADVNSDAGKKCAEGLGERAYFLELDVTREQSWEDAISKVLGMFGRIDVLVNNAGVLSISPLVDSSLDDYQRLVAVNQTGTYLGMRAVLPKMIEVKSGSIVNVASMNGIRGMPGESIYTATKHAIIGMTRSVALEVAAAGVRVNAVCPGPIDTPMLAEADIGGAGEGFNVEALLPIIPFKRLAAPSEVAEVVGFLASDAASYCSGSEFVVDGAWTAGLSFQ